ncbi:MAG: flavodoxin domain-containing protein [Eubacteriales bacterium]
MKTLIVYASTYGFAEECAKTLAGQVQGETVAINITKEKEPALAGFDNIVIGGSIYMGRVQKQVSEFCVSNLNTLLTKRVALFLCGGIAENYEQNMQNSYPASLLEAAVSKEYYGGELRKDKMSFAHKMLTSAIEKAGRKNGTPLPEAKPENIGKTAVALNA